MLRAIAVKPRAGALIAKNITATITVPTSATAVPWTHVSVNDPQFNISNGVITFVEDCAFNSTFFVNLSNVAGGGTVLTFFTDAESSSDGVVWVRGIDSLRKETVRGSDNNATRNFPFNGRFLAGTKIRFVWWASNGNCRVTTDPNNGSEAPAIRLTYNYIPAKIIG